MFLPDGTRYSGQLAAGQPEGSGRLDSPDGLSYVGAFRHGKPSGRSTVLRLDEAGQRHVLYEGHFQDGRPSGVGAVFGEQGAHASDVAYRGELEAGRIKRSALARESSMAEVRAEVSSNDPSAREYIRIQNKATGELRAVTIPGGFRIGDRVEAKIAFRGHTGELAIGDVGTVIGASSSDPEKQLKCRFPHFKELSLLATQISKVPLKVGDAVLCRDSGELWKNGKITSTSPLEVQPLGWAHAFAWSEVRRPQEVLMPGMKVKALQPITYKFPENADLNYEIPADHRGTVEEVDEAGHALVQWEAASLGQRWVRTESFGKLAEDAPEGASQQTTAEAALEVIGRWTQRVFGEGAPPAPSAACTPERTVWDLTAKGAAGGEALLAQGGCVVAFEANPAHVAPAQGTTRSAQVADGRLVLVPGVLATGSVGREAEFWVSQTNPEQSSFSRDAACSGDGSDCKKSFVSVVPCSHLFDRFGPPAYLKLGDGGAGGCFAELQARKARGESLPTFVSAEIPSKVHPALQLRKAGYTKFKLVQRGTGTAEAWGNEARDCGKGAEWLDFQSFQEVAQHLQENADANCPWSADGSTLYDVHASRN